MLLTIEFLFVFFSLDDFLMSFLLNLILITGCKCNLFFLVVTSFSSEEIVLHFSRVVVAVEIVSLAHTAFESHLYSYLLFLILFFNY